MLSVGGNFGTQNEKGDVVLPAGPGFDEELVAVLLDRSGVVEGGGGTEEPGDSGVDVLVAVLHKPVAVEDKDVAAAQRRFGRGTGAEADAERLPDGDFEDRGGAAAGH